MMEAALALYVCLIHALGLLKALILSDCTIWQISRCESAPDKMLEFLPNPKNGTLIPVTAVSVVRVSRPHSMRAKAQVTAPGAATSMIVAVSTRPNRQNRSRCSPMSVPLVQIQRLVNRFRRDRRSQIAVRPRHDR